MLKRAVAFFCALSIVVLSCALLKPLHITRERGVAVASYSEPRSPPISAQPNNRAPTRRYKDPSFQQPSCHDNDTEYHAVVLNECTPDEIEVPNLCNLSWWSENDHLALVSRGVEHSVEWVFRRVGPMMPFVIMDKTGKRPSGALSQQTVVVPPVLNSAHENDAYLYYIIAFYDCLPDITVFLHEHEANIHDPMYQFGIGNVTKKGDDIPTILSKVCWEKVDRYYSLAHHVMDMDNVHPAYNFTKTEFAIWMPGEPFPAPLLIFHCCTNFMVPRNIIHRRSRQFYVDLLNYINSPSPPGYPGLLQYLMEYTWEYIFKETEYLERLFRWAYPRRLWAFGFPVVEYPEVPFPKGYPPVEEIFGCGG